jgi:2-polyprenyl-6-hydroxyphenyl methylase / 3-demethylubiquinone-9 3-methyltransferase
MAAAVGVIDEEVRRFAALGDQWWNPAGPMAALHRLNPTRLAWMRETIAAHFGRAVKGAAPPLAGLSALDIGCGGGLVAEPLARMGADVIGLDPAPESIAVARAHAEATGAPVVYRAGLVEELVAETARFDVVTALEVVEHVADLRAFVAAAAALAKPGGLILASTLNRTAKSFALAIVGAEYVLGWVDKGTHRWEQFVTPQELAAALEAAGCSETARRGVVYDLLRRDWRLSSDVSVNYFMAAKKL